MQRTLRNGDMPCCAAPDTRSTIKSKYKEFLLDRCRARNYEWASQGTLRLEGFLDLIAAEARYHSDCMWKLMAIRNITEKESETDVTDI